MSALSQRQKILNFLHRVRTSTHAILQYDSKTDDLALWGWPLNTDGERVTPSDLRAHRLSHQFLGPCCMCPLRSEQPNFVEAAIFVVTSGRFMGEYVAECAQGECGYFIFIERIHTKTGVPVKVYPLRGKGSWGVLELYLTISGLGSHLENGEARPQSVFHKSERANQVPHSRALKRSYALRDLTNANVSEPYVATPFQQLLQLDSDVRPGITAAQFRALFSMCRCGIVTTRRVFHEHFCKNKRQRRDVIDLTGEDTDVDGGEAENRVVGHGSNL